LNLSWYLWSIGVLLASIKIGGNRYIGDCLLY
jgi:hypothetical protein